MAHGYARDFDEPIDRGGDDRGRSRDEDRGRWRGEDRDRGWRDEQRDPNERNRNFMLGDDDRSWQRDTRDQDSNRRGRGMNPYGGENRYSWSQGDDDRSGREQRSFGGGAGGADWERSPRTFSSHQDDHYRSWRDRQVSALDRDYQDYCREREEQFHRDFDSWRQNRQQRGGQSPNEATGEQIERERSHDRALTEGGNTPSPVGAATLGTNNSENTGTGRAKPQV